MASNRCLCNEKFNFLFRKNQLKGGAHEGLANICAQSSQYHGKEYPCANIDMQDRLISLVNAGIPDGKSELELKNNGFKSGLVYKLIQKEQQQLLNVVRCNSVINLARKHVSWNPGKTDNDDVRLSDSANEEVKDPDEEDQETREQLYQDLDADSFIQNSICTILKYNYIFRINDDQTSTVDILEPNNSDDSQQQYVSSTTNISSVTTAVIMKHRRVKRVYMLRTSPYGLRKRNGV
ncbi:unnamed protein product [Rotaria magnacalcarata]|uniref:Uncharacterized protein n=1 Tax=Rotaria magnacalcarata TaxID=392030 RepID=A0A819PCB7_9BILA|nr:unnamed protein product [Rotaria magnacalcarata]